MLIFSFTKVVTMVPFSIILVGEFSIIIYIIHYQCVTRSFRRTFYFFRQATVFLRHGFVRWLYFFPPLFGFQRSHHFVQGRRIESIPFYNKKRRIQRINASKQVLQTMNTKPFPCAVIIHIRFIGYNLSRTENVQHP